MYYYDLKALEDVLKCQGCNNPYTWTYGPRILPCCGKSVCEDCVKQIVKTVKYIRYKCTLCNEEEFMPTAGFAVNKIAAILVEELAAARDSITLRLKHVANENKSLIKLDLVNTNEASSEANT